MYLRMSLRALAPQQVLLDSFPHVNEDEGMHADLLIIKLELNMRPCLNIKR